mgnify:CR=1 FL=1
MANAIYPKAKQQFLQAGINMSSGTVKVALVDTAVYTYNAAHEFYDDGTTGDVASATVGTPQTLGTKTFTNGLFDAADSTFTAVSGATVEALVIYLDTGTPTTSRLLAYYDTGVTGLPATPNGGDITVTWNASGIFQL